MWAQPERNVRDLQHEAQRTTGSTITVGGCAARDDRDTARLCSVTGDHSSPSSSCLRHDLFLTESLQRSDIAIHTVIVSTMRFRGVKQSSNSWRGYLRTTSVLFWAVHLAAVIGVVYCGWSWSGLVLAIGAYFVRMVVVTAGYHRYFAHRAFKTSRVFQLLLALGAQ